MTNLIKSDTRVDGALRMRPLASELFAKRGLDLWGNLDKPVRELFRRERGGSCEDFLQELAGLPVPAPDCLWQELPVAYLLDYLTHEHREFFLGHVTDIDYLLDLHGVMDVGTSHEIRALQAGFREFVEGLKSEFEDEESRIFSRILRYEACLRDSRVAPEFQQGSLQIDVASHSSRFLAQRRKTLPQILARTRKAASEHPENPGFALVAERLADFETRLAEHDRLEMETLFPMGLEMERTLYNMSIDGTHTASHRVRGPMDSGILRLRHR